MSWSKSALRTMRYRGAPSAENDALSHGMAMVAVPVLFGFLGYLLDGQLGTGWIFVVLFAAFGVTCSFGSAYYRYERRIAEHDEGKPWTRARVQTHGRDAKEVLG
jgi:positive regulator of sigma E activity